MRTNTIKLSRTLAGKGQVAEIPQPTFRRGSVLTVETNGDTIVSIGDDPTPVLVVGSDANYIPAEGDAVNLRITDTETFIEGKAGNSPAVFAGERVASVAAQESRGDTAFGDLTTPGPAVTVTLGESGLLEVVASALITATDSSDGGSVGVELSGANTLAPDPDYVLAFNPKTSGAFILASRVLRFSGLAPGETICTLKYRNLTGTSVNYALREIVARPK